MNKGTFMSKNYFILDITCEDERKQNKESNKEPIQNEVHKKIN